MSAHVRESLSAYLDDELLPAERAAIDVHLRDCPECARHLEEVAALDTLARALPAEAPTGYFDDFSARVRARIGVPTPAQRPRRLPVWSLAAAAALLLAVLTPTLVREQSAPPPAPAADSFAVAPPAQQQLEGGLAGEAAPAVTLALDAVADKKSAASKTREFRNENGAEADRAPAQEARTRQAPKDVGEELQALGYVASPMEKSKVEARDDARAAGSQPEPATVVAAAPPVTPGPAATQPSAMLRDEASPGKAAAASELRGGALAYETETAETKTAARRQNRTADTPVYDPFQALLGRRVATAVEARGLREEWRAHALTAPAGEADEARVRAIEAGALAVKLSREATDLARLRNDVADYVTRADALQVKRARAALRAAEALRR